MEITHKKLKRVLAWVLVAFVGYITIYTYLHPEYVKYYEDETAIETMEYDPSIPVGKENMLMKEKNPVVFYSLKFQWLLVALGIAWWLFDMKGTKRFINKLCSTHL